MYKRQGLDAVEAKIQEAPMIYKGIEQLCGDPTRLRKKVEDYRGVASTYLSLKKVSSLCRHPTVIGQEKATCTKQVELAKPHLAKICTDLDALQERHRSAIQRITNLEETLRLA